MQNLINNAARLIGQYNGQLAQMWLAKPFHRVQIAHAFAAGFAQGEDQDVHPDASLVLEVAFLFRDATK